MSYEEEAFPAARRAYWPCATQTDRLTSPDEVTSVCYFQVPADPTLGGHYVVEQGLHP